MDDTTVAHKNDRADFRARIPHDVMERARALADELDLSMNGLIVKALWSVVDRHDRGREDWPTPTATVDVTGLGWATYAATVHFSLPAVEGADQRAYDVKDSLLSEAEWWGGRDVWTDMHAVRAIEGDMRQASGVRPPEPVRYSNDGEALKDYAPSPGGWVMTQDGGTFAYGEAPPCLAGCTRSSHHLGPCEVPCEDWCVLDRHEGPCQAGPSLTCDRCGLSIEEPRTDGPCWLDGILRSWHSAEG